jgi:branched-subunit amino acid aminotransferase/4-amino-4-deoxychorismate lyase
LTVSILDRGLRYGLGVFETLRVRESRPFLLGRHAVRMQQGMIALGCPLPYGSKTLARWGKAAVEVGDVRDGVLRLLATAGREDGAHPRVLAWARREIPYPDEMYERGLKAALHPVQSDPAWPGAGTKTLAYARYYLARRSAREQGFDEAILCAPGGRLAEGASSNLFLVEGGRLLTPPLDEGILPGVTRETVLMLAQGLSLETSEEPLERARVRGCSEAFLTGALLGVAGLVQVDDLVIGDGRPGPVTRKVAACYLSLAGPA